MNSLGLKTGRIPYLELGQWDKDELIEIKEAIDRVLRSGTFILGKELSSFESEFAQFLGSRFAVGTASGTDAITIALKALEISEGDEVITSCLTAYPTITGIERAGAIPVVVDVDERTGLISPVEIKRAITAKTRAIIPVHLWGFACNMPVIREIADDKGLKIVEDCAQGIGTRIAGKNAGGWSDCAAFSFYPTKNLGAVGDAGGIVTDDEAVMIRAAMIRNYGQVERDINSIPGMNSRLDEIQAAVLRVKLKRLPENIRQRREIAARYDGELESLKYLAPLAGSVSGYHIYPVFTDKRDELRAFLQENGVETMIHYPQLVHWQKSFYGRAEGNFDNAEKLVRQELSLPISPLLSKIEQNRIIELINSWSKKC